MLYYNRGYCDNYFIFQVQAKFSFFSFVFVYTCSVCVVAYSNYFFVLYCINFFLFWLYLLINNNEVYTKGDKI